MLSGTLGASLLGNILERKEQLAMEIKDKIMKKKKRFLMPPHPVLILKCKNLIKTNLDLMVFIQEIIYIK